MCPIFSLSRPIPAVPGPLLVFPANDIETPGVAVEAELPVAWLERELAEAEASATKAGDLRGRISRSGKADMVVRCRVLASLELPCARCLDPTAVDVDTELSLLLKPRPTAAGKGSPSSPSTSGRAKGAAEKPAAKGAGKQVAAGKAGSAREKPMPKRSTRASGSSSAEYEFTAEEADMDEYDGERVVLDGFVREAILLELPSFPLCRESCDGGAQAAELARVREKLTTDEAAQKKSPFEALRHLMDGSPLPSDGEAGNEGGSSGSGGPAGRRASAAEVRRATRAQSRGKPKIRSSIVGRGKK